MEMTKIETETQYTLLIVDDDPKYLNLLRTILEKEGYKTECASSGESALFKLSNFYPDLILLDVVMPQQGGFEVCKQIRQSSKYKDIPVIFLTSKDSPESIIEGFKLGAVDYITKPFNLPELLARVKTHLELKRKRDVILEMNRQLKKEIKERELAEKALHESKEKIEIISEEVKGLRRKIETSLEDALGKSAAVKPLISQIGQVASSQFSLILYGETGVGKSFLARIIHKLSPRSGKPFVAVDIGAIPETLVESELFGHKKGAFTGAVGDRKGFFQRAQGGTIFIDELENLSPYVQSKLLLAVDEKRIFPLGSQVPDEVDVRIIAATNRNLDAEVREGRFRQDLYYRLNDFCIRIPPLKERTDDIPVLAYKFVTETAEELNKTIPDLSTGALEILKDYKWPGNIRELKSVMKRAVLFCQKNIITTEVVSQAMNSKEEEKTNPSAGIPVSIPVLTMDELEKWGVREALRLTQGNKTEAAYLLKIGYSTLKRKMSKYGIKD